MNKRILAVIGLVILAVLLFAGGVAFAQSGWTSGWGTMGWQPGAMMNGFRSEQGLATQPGMMGGGMMGGAGMMNGGMMGGAGMMNGGMMGGGMMGGGMMGGGMMGGFGGLTQTDPLTPEEAEAALAGYLGTLDNEALTVGEIMIFSNHAYAQIVDRSTGQGAFEVLVDPTTGNVYPEPGPNMMWNTTYGMMANYGVGRMGGLTATPELDGAVTEEQAVELAQKHLDTYLPGKTADEHADAFPGYFTLHVLEDGEVIGMLSVNASTGQVFLHHWHGDFVEMAAGDHE